MNIRIYYLLFCLCILPFLQSCALYEVVGEYSKFDQNILIKEVSKVKLGVHCYSKDITTKIDTTLNQKIYKEVKVYDCRGAYSYMIKHKTWGLSNGKLKKMKN